ncbi:MAG: hypothetical protein WC749_16430 [Dehalococcoidia bacterium]
MAKSKHKKPPSRVRYEEANPTVSCRVSLEAYAKLKSIKEDQNMSFGELLLIGAGIMERRQADEAKLKSAASDDGYRKGCAVTERRFKISYHCAVCRETIDVTTPDEKKFAAEAFETRGWAHQVCPQKSPGF